MTHISQLTHSPFLLLFLLMACFESCVWLKKRTGWSIVNPTLITTIMMITALKVVHVDWQTFEKASNYLTFWLQPAVVCLAIPLYVQWQKIRNQWLPILVSQLLGSLVGIVSGVWLVLALGGGDDVAVALSVKSVTMPIAIEVTSKLQGVVGMTAAAVLIAGVVGQMMGIFLLYLVRAYRPMAQGLAMGTASHALGTVRVMQMGERYVAYATVGLIVNGVLTAFIAPWIVPWLMR
ncbi:MAG: LrgB family protein [Moraxella sp.]|nr:LrgB family protein [Moraxella sp.]